MKEVPELDLAVEAIAVTELEDRLEFDCWCFACKEPD